MLIEKCEPKNINFADIQIGDVFLCQGEWYIATEEKHDHKYSVNCVNLSTGRFGYCAPTTKISRVNKGKFVELP